LQNSNSGSLPQNLESRADPKEHGWFSRQDDEVLPFEPSASAVKQKAAQMRLNSPSPFSPAQQTPQKVTDF